MTRPFLVEQSTADFALWDKMVGERIPISFDLEITARCNNDCRHCYNNLPAGDHVATATELTPEEIERIGGEAVSLGAIWCLITGGEPLLRADFAALYVSLKKLGLLVSVFTNACLLNQQHMALFKEYPPRDLEVTVYGVTKDTYERVTRRPGSFDGFQRGLRLLLDNGIPVRLKAMALASNVQELPAIAAFCRQHTKDYFRFDPLLQLRSDRDPRRNQDILSERLPPDQVIAIERSDEEHFRTLEKGCQSVTQAEMPEGPHDQLFRCRAGQASFSVSHEGKFRLCSSLEHPETTYDLRSGSLAEAWRSLVPKVRNLRSHRPDLTGECWDCLLANVCSSCPAHAYLENGDMDARIEYFCRVAHLRGRACGFDCRPIRQASSPRA